MEFNSKVNVLSILGANVKQVAEKIDYTCGNGDWYCESNIDYLKYEVSYEVATLKGLVEILDQTLKSLNVDTPKEETKTVEDSQLEKDNDIVKNLIL